MVTTASVDEMIERFRIHAFEMLAKQGRHTFASSHEGLGICTEEYEELIAAVRSNDGARVQEEAMNLAFGAFWLALSSVLGALDWPKRAEQAPGVEEA